MSDLAPAKVEYANMYWDASIVPVNRDLKCITLGGHWKKKDGTQAGLGNFEHFKRVISQLWEEIDWHRWLDELLEQWLTHKFVGIMGPANCVAGETLLPDPITGQLHRIDDLCKRRTQPWVQTLLGPVQASVPFVKGTAELIEVKLSNGSTFRATAAHLVLTPKGFVPISALVPGSCVTGYEPNQPCSIAAPCQTTPFSGEGSCSETALGSLSGYRPFSGFYGGQPLCDSSSGQGVSPSLACAQTRNQSDPFVQRWDDRERKSEHTRLCSTSGLPSNYCGLPQAGSKGSLASRYAVLEMLLRASCSYAQSRQSQSGCSHQQPFLELPQDICHKLRFPFAFRQSWVQPTLVESVKFLRTDKFYDLNVPVAGHYFANGAIHHNSSKTCSMALFHLVDYYAFPSCTTTLLCSTNYERLEDRIWGEIKKWHKVAKKRYSWLPGNLIEGKRRLVTDHRSEANEGRDFRNGMVAVPCKPGGQYTGLGDFIGIKNKRVRLCGDELQQLPAAFIDALPNLSKNADFRATGMGNPKETTDALGRICEPSAANGGWDSGIDQTPRTKHWETRWPNGVCIQLCGSDSPNTDVDPIEPVPFPFLITRKQMEDDAKLWGRDDWHFTMFNEGRMPRGQGSRRVITRSLCERNGAFKQPTWQGTPLIEIGCLDAAYRAVGGDRCVYAHLRFGEENADPMVQAISAARSIEGLIDQSAVVVKGRHILQLVEMKIIPITANAFGSGEPEDQITKFVAAENKARGIKPENFFYDSGMRASLVQCFSRTYSTAVNAIDCGGKPTERKVSDAIDVKCVDYYSKLITEIWWSVRLIVEAGQFRGMTDEVLNDGCAREYKLVSGNKIEVETKEEMKKKTGRSPDLFDCLAIGVEGARRLGFRIARMRAQDDALIDNAWKTQLRLQASKFAKIGQLTYK